MSIEVVQNIARIWQRGGTELRAKLFAYLLAPLFVMALAVSGAYTSIGFDFSQAFTVTELQTQIDSSGNVVLKPGLAIRLQRESKKMHIPVKGASAVWTTLDQQAATANKEEINIGSSSLEISPPLARVEFPVTLIISGSPEGEIWSGAKSKMADWAPEPGRSISFLSFIMLVCALMFGVSLANAFPLDGRKKHGSTKKRA